MGTAAHHRPHGPNLFPTSFPRNEAPANETTRWSLVEQTAPELRRRAAAPDRDVRHLPWLIDFLGPLALS
jgi:hypothetical protein